MIKQPRRQSRKVGKIEWLTPPWLLSKLGHFDLDPCSPVDRPWDTAAHHYTIIDNGLQQKWFGRVWMNSPYGNELQIWLTRLFEHGNGIALFPSRTGTPWFHECVFKKANSLFYLEDRLWYHHVNGERAGNNAGHDSVLASFGNVNVEMIDQAGLKGHHDYLKSLNVITILVSGSWKEVVQLSMKRLDKEACVQEIYDMVAIVAPDKVRKNRHYKEKIRQTLQRYFDKKEKGVYCLN